MSRMSELDAEVRQIFGNNVAPEIVAAYIKFKAEEAQNPLSVLLSDGNPNPEVYDDIDY